MSKRTQLSGKHDGTHLSAVHNCKLVSALTDLLQSRTSILADREIAQANTICSVTELCRTRTELVSACSARALSMQRLRPLCCTPVSCSCGVQGCCCQQPLVFQSGSSAKRRWWCSMPAGWSRCTYHKYGRKPCCVHVCRMSNISMRQRNLGTRTTTVFGLTSDSLRSVFTLPQSAHIIF